MKLTYLYNSAFVIEFEHCTLIVDYFQDADNQYVRKYLPTFPGKLYVLASHWHPDHFNSDILQWKQIRPDVQYLLSKDILRKRLVNQSDADFLLKGQIWQDDTVCIHAFGSTDVGISFLIETEGKKIFHAGDLNNWHWSEESTPEEVAVCERHFLKEVDLLAKTTSSLDLTLFPVDPRQGKDYMLGAEQFVDRIRTSFFAPMHFGDDYEKANAFRMYTEQTDTRFIAWKDRGETIIFKKTIYGYENKKPI